MPRDKKEDLSRKRVYAKVEYKGRTYYVIAQTLTVATATEPALPLRIMLTGLAEDSLTFWADASACTLLKEYPGRSERGSYGRKTGYTAYTTLGNIRSFVADQRAKESAGVPQCADCRVRNSDLIEDLEDGLMKCRKCCDIPSE